MAMKWFVNSIYVIGLGLVAVTLARSVVYLVTGLTSLDTGRIALGVGGALVTGLTLVASLARPLQQRKARKTAGPGEATARAREP